MIYELVMLNGDPLVVGNELTTALCMCLNNKKKAETLCWMWNSLEFQALKMYTRISLDGKAKNGGQEFLNASFMCTVWLCMEK